jgi:hemerythrin superfamily protein
MSPRNVIEMLSPPITKMIRMDHSHVMVLSHKYTLDAPAERKAAIVESVCLALEIHAQLEEEIFYPALRDVAPEDPALQKAEPEHDEMRRLIGELRSMDSGDGHYDTTFSELIRAVLHHVADEETVLLPLAERLLKDRLCELGAQMTKRRLQLARPKAGQIAVNQFRAMPTSTVLVAGGLLAGAVLLGTAAMRRRA